MKLVSCLTAQFEIYPDVKKKYRWRLKSSGNYKIIADSAESYETLEACEQGVKLVQKEAASATIQHIK
jgi:uncharacterized protein YegP (UPF0339 family)